MNAPDLKHIAMQFAVAGEQLLIKPFGSGHIHQTFLVEHQSLPAERYVLQKINHLVFKDPHGVMTNINLVLEHLRTSKHLQALRIIPTVQGGICFEDHEVGFWRMYAYVENSYALDNVALPQQAYEGARAYGIFLKELSSLDARKLGTTIKDFHNLQWRFQQLKAAQTKNSHDRLNTCNKVVEYAFAEESRVDYLHGLATDPQLSLLVTHNDTKINNVLFDQKTDKAISVVDLDTVMPGLLMFDFGDMVRTFCNATEEDGAESDVAFQPDLFEATCTGFFENFTTSWSSRELESLTVAPWYMTFIMGIRFLADYLNGDIYYQTSYPQQNLNRARNQMRLCSYLKEAEPWMQQVIIDKIERSR